MSPCQPSNSVQITKFARNVSSPVVGLGSLVLCAVLFAQTPPAMPAASPPVSELAAQKKLDSPLVSLSMDALSIARTRLRGGDPTLKVSFSTLVKRADRALATPLRSVTQKTAAPPSGSKHDYVSMGPYWWPNPASANGLPYVRRDGVRNPEVTAATLDADGLVAMNNDARDLALAYFFTDDARYASRCADVLRTWFLNAETKMNPHMRFAQSIPGVVEGRGIGLIDGRDFWMAIDAALIIEPSKKLSADEVQQLRNWFATFAKWMSESDVGLEEAAAYNNHGIFYDAQLATYWRFAGEPAKARRVVFNATTLRIAGQIDRNGELPHEIDRTRPFHYTAFALQAAMQLAHHGRALDASEGAASGIIGRAWKASEPRCEHRQINCPLNFYEASFDGRGLKRAIESLASVVAEPTSWSRATKIEPEPPLQRALIPLLMAQQFSKSSAITKATRNLLSESGATAGDVAWLMWPLSSPPK
jgi:hypothetical protein